VRALTFIKMALCLRMASYASDANFENTPDVHVHYRIIKPRR
jgi:hypothetical protein